MGWTFRKRILLGKGLRINLGKRGASISAGRGLFGFNTGQILDVTEAHAVLLPGPLDVLRVGRDDGAPGRPGGARF